MISLIWGVVFIVLNLAAQGVWLAFFLFLIDVSFSYITPTEVSVIEKDFLDFKKIVYVDFFRIMKTFDQWFLRWEVPTGTGGKVRTLTQLWKVERVKTYASAKIFLYNF